MKSKLMDSQRNPVTSKIEIKSTTMTSITITITKAMVNVMITEEEAVAAAEAVIETT